MVDFFKGVFNINHYLITLYILVFHSFIIKYIVIPICSFIYMVCHIHINWLVILRSLILNENDFSFNFVFFPTAGACVCTLSKNRCTYNVCEPKKSLVWEQDRGKKATTSILNANIILHISQNLALTLTTRTWYHNNGKYFLVVLECTTNDFFSFQTSFSLSVV